MSRFNVLRPWVVLAGILIVYLALVGKTEKPEAFGLFHDDSAYFSSAKALADGQGYIIPSLPGTPTQTLYPIAYPWLLSWVWKLNPNFPASLALAIDLTKLFGCWTLLISFVLLRRIDGIGESGALMLTAICAVNPFFIFLSGVVLSDVPFMAVLLTAAVLADRAIRHAAGAFLIILTGVAASLAMSLRTIGVAFVAGVIAMAVCRKRYRELGIFLASAGVAFFALNWPTLAHPVRLPAQVAGPHSLEFGWQRTLADYTSYAQVWRFCVPSLRAFVHLVAINIVSILVAPGRFLLAPLEESVPPLMLYLMPAISVAMVAGVVRSGRAQGWKPVHFMLPFYYGVVLVWPYPQEDRFLLVFLALFLAGLTIEMRRLAAAVRASLVQPSIVSKVLAIAFAGVILFLMSYSVLQIARDDATGIRNINGRRAALMGEKLEAYDWIRQHTDAGARFMAYEDMTLFLFTARQAVRPTFSMVSAYMAAPQVLQDELAHIADAPHHIGAKFWLVSTEDFALDNNEVQIQRRIGEIVSPLPLLFRSSQGNIRIYDARCVADPQDESCRTVIRILFPELP